MADGNNPVGPNPAPLAGPGPAPMPQWHVLSNWGSLTLGQSPEGYAVYDERTTHGRWPLTEEGQRFAYETFEAHRQSLAHGVAYTATGYQDPERLGLPTDPKIKSQTYASPMSYVGSTRRIVSWATKLAKRSPAYGVLAWVSAVLALLFMWSFLIFWYFVVFFLFGIFTFPYRLIRRSQRKTLHVQKTALATQQAMLQQMAAQQAQMQRPQPGFPPPGLPPSAPPPGLGPPR